MNNINDSVGSVNYSILKRNTESINTIINGMSIMSDIICKHEDTIAYLTSIIADKDKINFNNMNSTLSSIGCPSPKIIRESQIPVANFEDVGNVTTVANISVVNSTIHDAVKDLSNNMGDSEPKIDSKATEGDVSGANVEDAPEVIDCTGKSVEEIHVDVASEVIDCRL